MLDQYLACAVTGQPAHTWPSLKPFLPNGSRFFTPVNPRARLA